MGKKGKTLGLKSIGSNTPLHGLYPLKLKHRASLPIALDLLCLLKIKVDHNKDPRGTVRLYSSHCGVVGFVTALISSFLGCFQQVRLGQATVVTMTRFVCDWWLGFCCCGSVAKVCTNRDSEPVCTIHRIQFISWPHNILEMAPLWSETFSPTSHNCAPCQTIQSPESPDGHRLTLSIPAPECHTTPRKSYVNAI